MVLDVFHTQEDRDTELTFPIVAKGIEQWLGDGFYFWQDYDFAIWWGRTKKCSFSNKNKRFCIFKSILTFNEDEFIDTVFNEHDYKNFVVVVEKFAKKYSDRFRKKPDLKEFNDFISDFGIWEQIKVIRFQDVPSSNEHVVVSGFYYKKRIQIRVNDPEIISTFEYLENWNCVN
jgi:hypothetical protein